MQSFVDAMAPLLRAGPVGVMVAAYLVGSIPFGLMLAKRFAATDVREGGSGNIGATNVARLVGKKLGFVTLGLDALKGAVPVLAVHFLWPVPDEVAQLEAVAGFFSVVGHCFPVWLRFRGGKGVATGIGALLSQRPVVGLIGVACFAVVYALFKRVSLAVLVAAPLVLAAFFWIHEVDATVPVLVGMQGVIIIRHKDNMVRLLKRTELKV